MVNIVRIIHIEKKKNLAVYGENRVLHENAIQLICIKWLLHDHNFYEKLN